MYEVQVKVEEIKKKRKSKVTEQGTRKKTRLEEEAIEKRIQRLRARERKVYYYLKCQRAKLRVYVIR